MGMRTGTPDKVVQDFGREVKRRREEAGLTQEEFAERVDMTSVYIGRVELGNMRRGLSLACANRIAQGFNTTLAELVGGVEGLKPVGIEAGRIVQGLHPIPRESVMNLLHAIEKSS